MSTIVPLVSREDSNRGSSSAIGAVSGLPLVRGGMALWVTVAILAAIALAWVLPPASSYRIAIPSPQWVTAL